MLEATYGGEIVELPGGELRARRAAPPPPLMLAALHTLTDPWADPVGRRALLEVALLGVAGGALGCWIVFYSLSYSAESLAHALLPGLVFAALTGIPLLLGGAAGLLVAAIAIAAAGQVPAIGRDTAVAVVVTTLFGAGVLLALSPVLAAGPAEPALRRRPRRLGRRPRRSPPGWPCSSLAALALLHARLLAVGFDRLSAPGLGVRPLVVDLALLALVALALLVAVQGLGNLLVVAALRRAGVGRAPGGAADGPDDGGLGRRRGRGRRRRAVPLLLRRHRRRGLDRGDARRRLPRWPGVGRGVAARA